MSLNANTSAARGTPTLGGRLFVSAFFLIFAAGGATFVVVLLRDAWADFQTLRWPEVPCKITSSAVVPTDSGFYRFAVAYQYNYPSSGGSAHIGTAYQRKAGSYSDYVEAQRLTESYPLGAATTCRVNPDDPIQAVLIPTIPWYALLALFPMLFVAVGLGGFYLMWQKPAAPAPPTINPATKVRRPKPMGPLGTCIVSSLFCLVGLGILIPVGVMPAMQILSARNWIATPCTIVSSTIRGTSVSFTPPYQIACG